MTAKSPEIVLSASVIPDIKQDVLDKRIQQTQITRLIEAAGFSNVAGIVMTLIWAGLLWESLPRIVLSVWLGMMTLLFLYRAVVHYYKIYQQEKTRFHLDSNIIRRWYLISVLLTGAGWGITSTLMFPYNEIYQVVLAFILIGVSASGVTYASVAWVYYGYVGLVLLPLMIRLFYVGGDIYYALSAMTGFFLGVMIMAAYRMNRLSYAELRLSYQNEVLISELTEAGKSLETLNSDLKEEIWHSKQIEIELQQAKENAEKMSQAKGEFLANMSHEIRTPMNGVMGTLQLLEASRLTPEQLEYVQTANKSAEALLSILNDILDLSKIEAGKLSFEIIPFDLGEIIHDLVVLYSLKAEQQGVTLCSHIDEKLPITLRGDPTRLRQILLNLISNALKFTQHGSVDIVVTTLSAGEGCMDIKIAVTDTGIGIPEHAQSGLFKAFTQADGSTTRKYGGTGLGLAIVSQLVDMMGGELGLKSKEEKGSTFWFIIPFEVSRLKLKKSNNYHATKAACSLTGSILLVEDNPVNQMVACKMLEKTGVSATLVNNGLEALTALDNNSFDLVLMDCQMPEMDGFEATRVIRQKNIQALNGGVLPVIAMTANVMEGDRQGCLDAGMNDYIGKPVKIDELETVLQRWL